MSLFLRRSWLNSLARSWFGARPVRWKKRSRPLTLEELETRLTPTISSNAYVVNVLGDSSGSASGMASSDKNPLHGDLRYVLNLAIKDQTADTITFDPTVFTTTADKTITLSSSLVTAPPGVDNPYGQTGFILGGSDNITIDGSLGSNTPGITIAGGGATRLFVVEGGGSLTLDNLTLSGGSATGGTGGAGADAGGSGGGAAGLGGAVLLDGGTSSFTAAGCTFFNNQATGGQGGSAQYSSNYGGGGGSLGPPNPGGANTRANNGGGLNGGVGGGPGGLGGGGGGGGSRGNGGSGGFGGGGGGGGDSAKGGTGGFGGGGGGGGGEGPNGAGGKPGFGAGTGGHSGGGGGGAGLGGAIFSNSGSLNLDNDTFTGNAATGGAGGSAYLGALATSGQGLGGAVFVRNGSLTATFDTFSSNTVKNGDSTAGTATDLYVLSDGSSGTGFSAGTATATITNSILGQNAATTVSDFYAGTYKNGTAPSLGNSTNDLLSVNPASPNGLTGTHINTGNPNFVAGGVSNPTGLAYNGGPTQTIALTAGSTAALQLGAIGTGITVDQRGRTRSSTPDLGAYQLTSPGPRNFVVDVLGDNSGSAAGTPSSDGNPLHGDLRYVLNQAIEDQSADTITFDPTVFTTTADTTITLSASLVTEPLGFANPYGQTGFIVGAADNITINGSLGANTPGITITGGGATRLFVVEGGGSLTLDNVTLSGGSATGGKGGDGAEGGSGGGGAGVGGAVLVDGSTFTAAGCTFVNNQASGGQGGGTTQSALTAGGGGGGGLGSPDGGVGTSPTGLAGLGGGVNGGPAGHPGHTGGMGGFGGGGGGGGGSFAHGGQGGFGGGGGGGGGNENGIPNDNLGGKGGSGGFGGGGGGAGGSTAVGGQGGFGGGSGAGIAMGSGRGAGGGGGAGLGGAVFATAGTITLTNDTFALNKATGGQGGNVKTTGNPGQGDGGAVFVRNGTLTATFDTFSSNAVSNGDNSAGTGSDLYVLSDGSGSQATATITNSILGQDSATTVSDFYANTYKGGTTPSFGTSTNDLLSVNAASPNGLTGTHINTGNPNFAAGGLNNTGLTNNGGPTQTIALTVGSTAALQQGAIGTGITVDQRGRTRSMMPDLGAYQFTSPGPRNFVVDVLGDNSGSAAGTPSSDNNPLHGDLRYVLNQAIEDQTADSITFDPTVFATAVEKMITLSASLETEPLGFTNPYGETAFILGASDNIKIDGSLGVNTPGITIAGGGATRLFVVEGGGTLTLMNLMVSGGSATGGAAGGGGSLTGGGGGGAGLGGAVLVDGSNFTAAGCTFVNNQARGGAGGSETRASGSGGGGGGLGPPNGGDAKLSSGGTGGGVNGGPGAPAKLRGGGFGGGGGGGPTSGSGGGGGFGGGGGGGGEDTGGNGGAGGFGGGGGGGGAGSPEGAGGSGGFGGGSGAGGTKAFGHALAGGGGGGGAGLGGAVFATGGTLTLTNDTLTGNTATGGAGGTIASTGRAGQGDGGAVFVRNGTLTAIFDTFSGNTVTNGDSTTGAASDVYVLSDGTSGTGFSAGMATATLTNDILGQTSNAVPDFVANTNDNATAPTLAGSKDIVRNNNTVNPDTGTGLPSAAIYSSADPMLATLGYYGVGNTGPTETLALEPNSPALTHGVAVDYPGTQMLILVDQRGIGRPNSNPDIGAFQHHDTLMIAIQPMSVASGKAFAVTVVAKNDFDNTDMTFTSSVSLQINTGPTPSKLSGTASMSATSGSASITGISLDHLGAYTLQATAANLTSVNTSSIQVTAGKFVVTSIPSVTAGVAFSLVVHAEDILGNTDIGYTGPVVLSSNDPLAPKLGTFQFIAAGDGILTITGLVLKHAGTETIGFSGTSSGVPISGPVNVTVRAAAVYKTIEVLIGNYFYIEELDIYGNVILLRRTAYR